LYLLAAAAHPIMDSSSPHHTDSNGEPKTWDFKWWNPATWWGHSPNERIGSETKEELTKEILAEQRKKLEDLYNQIFKKQPSQKKK
jgi:nucleoside-specific outer membrane channel protein Tsx